MNANLQFVYNPLLLYTLRDLTSLTIQRPFA